MIGATPLAINPSTQWVVNCSDNSNSRYRDAAKPITPRVTTVLDESIVEMTYITRHSQAIPGQKVFTSGLGGIFPKGIPIGHITDTNSVGYGLYIEARVKLSANLQELEEVFVLFP